MKLPTSTNLIHDMGDRFVLQGRVHLGDSPLSASQCVPGDDVMRDKLEELNRKFRLTLSAWELAFDEISNPHAAVTQNASVSGDLLTAFHARYFMQ